LRLNVREQQRLDVFDQASKAEHEENLCRRAVGALSDGHGRMTEQTGVWILRIGDLAWLAAPRTGCGCAGSE
jgi:hypothetical protein